MKHLFTQISLCVAALSFAVSAHAEIEIVLTGLEGPFHLGDVVVLNSTITPEGTYTYSWTNRAGEVLSTEATLTDTPTRPEVYKLTVSAGEETAVAYAEIPLYGVTEPANFEDNPLNADNYWAGREDGDDLGYGMIFSNFFSGGFMFSNCYMPDWYSWSFFGLSARTEKTFDSSTYAVDQFNCVSGGGHESAGFGVAYVSSWMGKTQITTLADLDGAELAGVYINNNMYLYNSVTNGDAYATPFAKGSYEKVVFTADNGNAVEFYLADYRSDNEADWYVVTDWTFVDLSPLGKVTTIDVTMEGDSEMTPTYFCLDDLTYAKEEDGVGSVAIDNSDAPVEYFNLNGVRVSDNLTPGIYIRRQGSTTTKILVK